MTKCIVVSWIGFWNKKDDISKKANEICIKSVVYLIVTVGFSTSDVCVKIQGKVVIYNNLVST